MYTHTQIYIVNFKYIYIYMYIYECKPIGKNGIIYIHMQIYLYLCICTLDNKRIYKISNAIINS